MQSHTSMALLAEDLSGARLGLRLPAGRLVNDVEGNPIWWLAEATPDHALLGELHAKAAHTGLWPVALNLEGIPQSVHSNGPMPSVDAKAVIEEWSASISLRGGDHDHLSCQECQAMIEYHRIRPGAAMAAQSNQDPGRTAADLASQVQFFAPRLGLVGCEHSADIPAVLNWDGPANYRHDLAEYRAVLRQWEEHFGARVVALHGASLVCSVASPPRTFERALALAAEHLAFCPDLAGEFHSINAHAAALVGVSLWTFWWD